MSETSRIRSARTSGPDAARRAGKPRPGSSPEDQVERAFAEAARMAAAVDWDSVLPPRAWGLRWRAGQVIKRAVDLVAALAGLLMLSPLLLLIALLVVVDSRGPAFYPWRVLGYRGRRFTGYKFRTMVIGADDLKNDLLHLNEMTGPVFKMKNDPRVTRVGRLLRKYSLDELPQLLSVLLGDMSLVGPRPSAPHEFVRFRLDQCLKLAVRPGITCLWQVSGRSAIRDFDDWIALDMQYIARWSLWLDLEILARTVPTVLRGRGAY